MKVIPEMCCAH